jgi:ribosomal protein L28
VVTFSNKHNRKWQEPNLQYKKVFWEQGQRWVKLRICTKVGAAAAQAWGVSAVLTVSF